MAKPPKVFQGGGVGNGGAPEPRRRKNATMEVLTLDTKGEALAAALTLFAERSRGMRYNHETGSKREPEPFFRIGADEADQRDAKVVELEAAFALAGVPFEKIKQEDHPEFPYSKSRFTAEYTFDAKAMLDFLQSERVLAVKETIRRHEDKMGERDPQNYRHRAHGTVPLDMTNRIWLVDMESDCKKIAGVPARVIGPGDAGARGGNKDHAGIGQHNPGGRED